MRCSRPVVLLALLLAAAVLTAQAAGDARPPFPPGAKRVAPGHVPGVCAPGQGSFDSATTFGTYWSTASRSYVQGPLCYPRWGNLEMSASQIVRAGQRVTMTATPTEGSNSAEYAPRTASITWRHPGRRVAGCGRSDLTCTVIVAPRATKEWQWGEFQVSMPRTFFINSRGSNCAGQEICAGFTTNAWGWAGVPPRGQVPVSGRVVAVRCASCGEVEGVPGVTVRAVGEDDRETARTGADGRWSMAVARGRYTVTPSLAGRRFTPRTRRVDARGAVRGVDFETCATPGARAAVAARAAQGPPSTTFSGEHTDACGIKQRFEFRWFYERRTMKVTWTTGFQPGCGSPSRQVTRTFDVTGRSFRWTIAPSLGADSGLTATGAIDGDFSYTGRTMTGVTVRAARVAVQYPESTCLASLPDGVSVDLR